MVNNLTSQSAVLQLNGVPNDLINNLNPITLVIFIPIMDFLIYPALRKARINFTPIKRITWGFFIASVSMISAAVMQYYIYQTSACPQEYVNEGEWEVNGELVSCTAPINVWVQAVPYCLIAFSEIFASITGLEYAFSMLDKGGLYTPHRMRYMPYRIRYLFMLMRTLYSHQPVNLDLDGHLTRLYVVYTYYTLQDSTLQGAGKHERNGHGC
jgi:hypothetical protein